MRRRASLSLNLTDAGNCQPSFTMLSHMSKQCQSLLSKNWNRSWLRHDDHTIFFDRRRRKNAVSCATCLHWEKRGCHNRPCLLQSGLWGRRATGHADVSHWLLIDAKLRLWITAALSTVPSWSNSRPLVGILHSCCVLIWPRAGPSTREHL